MKHGSITHEGAAPDFFEGALLGNGGLGAVVTTRPDAVVIHFGHNEVWDIRVEEGHAPGSARSRRCSPRSPRSTRTWTI
jgi:alpha-L-fucosidase 2